MNTIVSKVKAQVEGLSPREATEVIEDKIASMIKALIRTDEDIEISLRSSAMTVCCLDDETAHRAAQWLQGASIGKIDSHVRDEELEETFVYLAIPNT